jgi:sarcosine oxidase
MPKLSQYDVAVIGAGVFGAWTAYHLRRSGRSVVLLDAYGPGNSRASSGGESRIIRMGYGAAAIYTRWSLRALDLWREFCERSGRRLFHQTGVLWLARDNDPYVTPTESVLQETGARFERLARTELDRRFPQFHFGGVTWGLYEPESGVLMARRAVQAVVEEAVREGVTYYCEAVAPPRGQGRLDAIITAGGEPIRAGQFVFACGPWLAKLFPEHLAGVIHPTRQEVFFFGAPPGDPQFAPPAFPAWIDFGREIYGLPDLEGRGVKLAPDRRGPPFDPDAGERVVPAESIAAARRVLAERFPALRDAPLVESRVCQYENTATSDFLIDRHPDFDNVWLVGGGSGHGFKHGPALAEYVAARLADGAQPEPRFQLAGKG